MNLLDVIEQAAAAGPHRAPAPAAGARCGYAIYATDTGDGEEYVSYAEAYDDAQALERCRSNFDENHWTGHRARLIGPAA